MRKMHANGELPNNLRRLECRFLKKVTKVSSKVELYTKQAAMNEKAKSRNKGKSEKMST